jgi:tungstate transport system permease protein
MDGLLKALQLIVSGDPAVFEITLRSLLISGSATVISALWGIPIAIFLGLKDFRGKFVVKSLFSAFIGIPTVALGLILYMAFSKTGPLGFLGILYTPTAMMIGQSVLVTPILVSFTANAIESVDREVVDLAKTLGASEPQVALTILREALNGVFLAVMASFNRAVSELGLAWMLGGYIAGLTRVLTTSIAVETEKGNINLSIALGVILLALVFGINIMLNLLQRRRR